MPQTKWIARVGALLLLSSVIVFAADVPAAPAPPQVAAARRVFISNGGQFSGPYGDYSGNPDRCYNQFYAAVKSWGRLDLTDGPADTDLVMEVKFANPPSRAYVSGGQSGYPGTDPIFTLTIFDSKTHFVLWTLAEHPESAKLKGNRDKNYDKRDDRIGGRPEAVGSRLPARQPRRSNVVTCEMRVICNLRQEKFGRNSEASKLVIPSAVFARGICSFRRCTASCPTKSRFLLFATLIVGMTNL